MKQSRRTIFYSNDLALEKLTSWVRHQLTAIAAELENGTAAEVTIVLPSQIYKRLPTTEMDRLINKELDRHRSVFRILVQEGD